MDLLSSSQCIVIQLCIQRTMYSFSDYVSMRKKLHHYMLLLLLYDIYCIYYYYYYYVYYFHSLQECHYKKWKKEALVFRWSGYYINIAKSWIKKILKWSNNRGGKKFSFFNAIQNNHIISELIKYYFIHFLRYQKLGENQIILELFLYKKMTLATFSLVKEMLFKMKIILQIKNMQINIFKW